VTSVSYLTDTKNRRNASYGKVLRKRGRVASARQFVAKPRFEAASFGPRCAARRYTVGPESLGSRNRAAKGGGVGHFLRPRRLGDHSVGTC
jgi:hypothetical protein